MEMWFTEYSCSKYATEMIIGRHLIVAVLLGLICWFVHVKGQPLKAKIRAQLQQKWCFFKRKA